MSVAVGFAALLSLCVAGTSGARAFDCAKASSEVEKAICADQALKEIDDRMARTYAEVRAASSGAERKALADSQRKWLKSREDRCAWEEKPGGRAECILETTQSRRKFLAGEPVSGPGTGARLIPVFVQQDGDRRHYDIDYSLLRFAEARSKGEKLFNARVDAIREEAPDGVQGEEAPEDMVYMAYQAMTASYASPALLSVAVESYAFEGGAHGNGGTGNLNIALATGKVLAIGDILPEAAMPKLKESCKARIVEQKKEKNDGAFNPAEDMNYSEDTISEHLATIETWSFFADKAVVTFNPYAIGAYAEGPFTCEFAMPELKALALPGAPLPD